MNWLEIIAFVALGLFAGTYGTLVGIGGGVFIVPVLIFAHFAPKEAAGTSIAVVLANAVSGSISFLREKRVAVRTGVQFALAGLPGALLGAYVDQLLPRHVLSLIIGVFLLIMAARLLFTPQDRGTSHEIGVRKAHPWLAICIAFIAGFVASVFGVGGGILYVPSMLYVLQFSAHVATATSTFAIALTALFGTISHAYYGDIRYAPAASLALGAVVGAQIGVRLAGRIPAVPLVRLFALAVFLSSAWLIYHAVK